MLKWMMMLMAIGMLSLGCKTQKYGQCEPPQDELEILFKAKSSVNVFSHSFCVVCNTQISPDEYEEWAIEMGSPQTADAYDNVHPCFYVYPPDSLDLEDGIDSLALCESLVCDGGAEYADMVGKGQGNFDVTPLLNGTAMVGEEWMLDDGALDLRTLPAAHEETRLLPGNSTVQP